VHCGSAVVPSRHQSVAALTYQEVNNPEEHKVAPALEDLEITPMGVVGDVFGVVCPVIYCCLCAGWGQRSRGLSFSKLVS